MGRGTHGEVWDRSRDPRGGPGRVGGNSGRSGTCRGTIVKVQDRLGDPRGGPGLVGGPWESSVTGRWTLGVVRNGSGDPPKCGTGCGNLEEA